MRLANHDGRATIVVDGHAVDVEQASGGALGSDPMVLSDLANHAALRAIAVGCDAGRLAAASTRRSSARRCRARRRASASALNYKQHAIESGRDMPTEPHLFGKTENCVCGPFDEIVVPAGPHRDRLRGRAGHRVRAHLQGRHPRRRVELPRRRHVRAGHLRPGRAVPSAGEAVHHRQDRTTRSAPSARTWSPPTNWRTPTRWSWRARVSGEVMQHSQHQRPHLRRAGAGGVAQPLHHVPARRPGVDRHARRCGRGPRSVPARRRRGGDRDRGHRHACAIRSSSDRQAR